MKISITPITDSNNTYNPPPVDLFGTSEEVTFILDAPSRCFSLSAPELKRALRAMED